LAIIDKKHLEKIVTILTKKGFPSEAKVGVFIHNDTAFTGNPLNVVIRHLYQRSDFTLTPLLKKEVLKGNLNPNMAIDWLEMDKNKSKQIGYGIEPFWIINGKVYQVNNSPEQLKTIESNRTDLMATSYEHFLKRIVYANFTKTNIVNFNISGAIAIFDGLPKEMEENIAKSLNKTDYIR
jgi:hypothetical protein